MQTTNNYPTGKVISTYALLGGLVGGVLFLVGGGLYMLFEQGGLDGIDTSSRGIGGALIGIIVILISSWLFGLIPAWATGLFLAKTRTHWQITKPFCVGAVLSFVITFVLVTVFSLVADEEFELKAILETLKNSLIFALLGGLSSIIVGKLVLPKT